MAKRDAAQKTLEALRSAIQSAAHSGIDTDRIKAKEQELQDQLTETTDDSSVDEITTKARRLTSRGHKGTAQAADWFNHNH